MTKLHCDICDRVINETDAVFNYNSRRNDQKGIVCKSLDICVDCHDKIKDFVEKLSKNGENCAKKV